MEAFSFMVMHRQVPYPFIKIWGTNPEKYLWDILQTLFSGIIPGEHKLCTLGVFHALAFAADFPPVAPEFYQRTHRVRLKNLGTTDKKSSRKIKYKKIPRVHF